MALSFIKTAVFRCTSQSITSQSRIFQSRPYARWTHRNPSKVYTPSDSNEEEIIDLDPELIKHTYNLELANITNKDLGKSKKKNPKVVKNENKSIVEKSNTENMKLKIEKEIKDLPKVDFKQLKQRRVLSQKSKQIALADLKVIDQDGEVMYEKLKDNDTKINNLLMNLKMKKYRARHNLVAVENWRLIVDGLKAGCKLETLIFSRKPDLQFIKPFLPKKGVRVLKMPYKEMELWSDVETSTGMVGIFQIPDTSKMNFPNTLPMNIVCDNVREPGNLGAILRVAAGAGCQKLILMKGCVDLWEPKVIRSGAGAHFRLPIHNSTEWENMTKTLDPATSMFIADSNLIMSVNEKKKQKKAEVNETTFEEQNIQDINIPLIPYYGIDFSNLKSITLFIGGETEGISEECYKFVAQHNGLRLNIPLNAGVNSLNTGMATAVITFEIKKQILKAAAQSTLSKETAN